MKFKLLEKDAYHYGDLDIAKKSELGLMGGRGTGHFGSGYYLIGTYEPDKAYDYSKRGHWVINLDNYNLFKPRSNSDGYKLHDALKVMNNSYLSDTIKYNVDDYWEDYSNIEKILDNISDFLYDLAEDYYGLDSDKHFWDLLEDYYNKELPKDIYNQITDCYKNAFNQIKLIYDKFNFNLDADLAMDSIAGYGNFDISKDFKNKIDDHNYRVQKFERAIFDLHLILNVPEEKLIGICKKAIEITDKYKYDTKEDSTSTLIMKALGYEGIDVTHLNKDGEGLRGLDNFDYGSVIYDLKPGTYKKIKDKQ